MTVSVLQLRLHHAAEAAAIRPVQPLADHPQPVVSLLAVEGEVFHFGSNPFAPFGLTSSWPPDLHTFLPAARIAIQKEKVIESQTSLDLIPA